MPAMSFDLLIEQGADYHLSIPVLDATDAPVSMAGSTVAGQIRASSAPTAPLLYTLPLTVGATTAELVIPAAASSAWPWRLARYSIELTAPDATVTRLVEGRVLVYPEITRA